MAAMELKSSAKDHLVELVSELTDLVGNAQPVAKSGYPTACWSTNSEDVNVALAVIRAAASSIHDGVTRFNLVYKSDPGEAASESMAKEMGGFCQRMVSSLTLLSSVGASKAMVGYYSAGVRAVLHSFKDLVEALLDPSRHSQLNSLTGMVWQTCKELQQAPKTNKLACRRQMMQWSVAMKDTIDEFHEAAKSAAAANADKPDATEGSTGVASLNDKFDGLGVGGEGVEEGGDFDDDFGGMDEDYSPSELRCVEASVDVLRVFRRCLKAANDSLNTLDSPQTPGDGGSAAESKGEGRLKEMLEWAQALQSCLDEANECAGELGFLLYPPLSRGDLTGRADDMEQSLLAFCDVFKRCAEGAQVGGGAGGEQSPLRKAVEEKWGVLRAGLAQL